MKTFYTILKILAVLAAIAGIVFVVATYGDKIVAWARATLQRLGNLRGSRKIDIDDLAAMDTDFAG